jgi:hypothetical protein
MDDRMLDDDPFDPPAFVLNRRPAQWTWAEVAAPLWRPLLLLLLIVLVVHGVFVDVRLRRLEKSVEGLQDVVEHKLRERSGR